MKRLNRQDYLWLCALLAVVTLLALPVLTYPLGRDQGEFATIGRGLLEGHVPYRDLWNPKPPAVFYVYAAAMALFGRSSEALRALDLLIVPVIGAALFWLGRRFANRRVGLWVALVFAVFYFTETFWTLTQNDGIVLLPMTLALVCMVKAVGTRSIVSLRWAFLAGVLCGVVVLFKYPFALFGLVVAAGYMILRRQQVSEFVGTRHAASLHAIEWRVLLAFLLGGALVIGGGAVYLAAMGAWDGLLESARVTAGYTALTFDPAELLPLLQTALGFRWQQWGLLFVLVAVGVFLPSALQARSRLGSEDKKGWLIVWLWLLAGLAIMLVQAKGYDYHWLPMLPPLALLAGSSIDRLLHTLAHGLTRLTRLSPQTVPSIASAAATLGLLAVLVAGIWPKFWPYLTGQEDRLAYYRRFQAGEFVADESLRVADYLRQRTTPGDSLFIWGFRPEVYYLSGLNPATRFIFQFPLVADWYPAAWRQETVDTLWAALPPYVLVLQVDYMPWVTGRHEDSNTLLQEFTELNNWLMFNYERDTQIGNFFVWRRKPT
ncbi:MAG: glycosyltransferase family 39 protein [Chloroflexi bacterium]|nr:glycosyltransferase family 39 protein [Chloroflexota bacterium]